MDTLVDQVAQRTGLPPEGARTAVETVLNFLKQRLPPGMSQQIDNIVGGGESGGGDASGGESGGAGGIAESLSGMLGKKS